MSQPTLEERIQRLEDIEALRVLKARYAEFCDDDFSPDQLAALFTEDAIWDGGAMGRAEGRESIRKFFARASRALPFALHHYVNPVLVVDGDRATGRWHLLQPCVQRAGNTALWITGRYEDEYRREGGAWLFSRVTFRLTMMSPYEAGWAKTRMLEMPA